MRSTSFLVVVVALGLVGCTSSVQERLKTEKKNACAPASVSKVLAARELSRAIIPGFTTQAQLNAKLKPTRTATLTREGQEPLQIAFYTYAVPGCPWLSENSPYLPVVSKGGRVLGYGTSTLLTLQRQGWHIAEATWPWQSYSYNYLPQR
jgi:hypothetical protein